MLTEPERALISMATILERIEIPYVVGGSVASSRYGEPRATNDVDVVIDVGPRDAHALAAALAPEFEVDEESVGSAAKSGRMFQAFHRSYCVKFDFYVAGDDRLGRLQIHRRRREQIGATESESVCFSSAEDLILRKLDWYRRSGGVLERQLKDVRGVLQVQGASLDFAYLRIRAAEFGLAVLLERALGEAGMGAPPV